MKAEHAPTRHTQQGKYISFRRCARSDFRPWWFLLGCDAEDRHPHWEAIPSGWLEHGRGQPAVALARSWQRSSNRAGVMRYVPAPRTARGEPSRCLTDPGPQRWSCIRCSAVSMTSAATYMLVASQSH